MDYSNQIFITKFYKPGFDISGIKIKIIPTDKDDNIFIISDIYNDNNLILEVHQGSDKHSIIILRQIFSKETISNISKIYTKYILNINTMECDINNLLINLIKKIDIAIDNNDIEQFKILAKRYNALYKEK